MRRATKKKYNRVLYVHYIYITHIPKKKRLKKKIISPWKLVLLQFSLKDIPLVILHVPQQTSVCNEILYYFLVHGMKQIQLV